MRMIVGKQAEEIHDMEEANCAQLDADFARAIGLDCALTGNDCFVGRRYPRADGSAEWISERHFPAHKDWNLVMPEVVKRHLCTQLTFSGPSFHVWSEPHDDVERVHVLEPISDHDSPDTAARVACMKAIIAYEEAKRC
jgi:hypothetical protein